MEKHNQPTSKQTNKQTSTQQNPPHPIKPHYTIFETSHTNPIFSHSLPSPSLTHHIDDHNSTARQNTIQFHNTHIHKITIPLILVGTHKFTGTPPTSMTTPPTNLLYSKPIRQITFPTVQRENKASPKWQKKPTETTIITPKHKWSNNNFTHNIQTSHFCPHRIYVIPVQSDQQQQTQFSEIQMQNNTLHIQKQQSLSPFPILEQNNLLSQLTKHQTASIFHRSHHVMV